MKRNATISGSYSRTGRSLLVAATLPLVLAGCGDSERLRVATYNVETLFDAEYDGSEFSSFDPRSERWGPNRYERSLENTVRVIEALAEGDGADVLALQEVENQAVLADLSSALSSLGYTHRVLVENTGAFHNAIFSRYPMNSVRTHGLSLPWSRPGRYILEVDIDWNGVSLRFMVNHWHSKSGGAESTERSRREAAAVVARRIRETAAVGGPPVITLGDLNTNADEYARIDGAYPTALLPDRVLGAYDPIRALYVADDPGQAGVGDSGVVVYSPWTAGAGPGSYVYQGQWNSLDHILLGPGFTRPGDAAPDGPAVCASREGDDERSSSGSQREIVAGAFSVLMEPFMLDERGAPRRWRADSASGYSDHLPVEMVFCRR